MRESGNVALAELTTLRLGGPARRLVEVDTADELVATVRELDAAGEPLLLIGGGSNLVVPDEGFAGTVVAIRSRGIRVDSAGGAGDRVRVAAAAGEPWDELVGRVVTEELAGIECLAGIPGLTGATPVQNVGAYGQEVAQTVEHVQVYDRRTGETSTLSNDDCDFGYRNSRFKRELGRWVVLEVTFGLRHSLVSEPIRYAELARALGVEQGQRAPLSLVRETVLRLRRGKGMVLDPADPDTASAGSFFTNPILTPEEFAQLRDRAAADVPCFSEPDGRIKVPAAWLIGQAGFTKGHGSGAARVSSKHTLALTNQGGASAAELLALARELRDGVREQLGVELVPEPVLVGQKL